MEGSRDMEEGETDEGKLGELKDHQTACGSSQQVMMIVNDIHQERQLVELKKVAQ